MDGSVDGAHRHYPSGILCPEAGHRELGLAGGTVECRRRMAMEPRDLPPGQLSCHVNAQELSRGRGNEDAFASGSGRRSHGAGTVSDGRRGEDRSARLDSPQQSAHVRVNSVDVCVDAAKDDNAHPVYRAADGGGRKDGLAPAVRRLPERRGVSPVQAEQALRRGAGHAAVAQREAAQAAAQVGHVYLPALPVHRGRGEDGTAHIPTPQQPSGASVECTYSASPARRQHGAVRERARGRLDLAGEAVPPQPRPEPSVEPVQRPVVATDHDHFPRRCSTATRLHPGGQASPPHDGSGGQVSRANGTRMRPHHHGHTPPALALVPAEKERRGIDALIEAASPCLTKPETRQRGCSRTPCISGGRLGCRARRGGVIGCCGCGGTAPASRLCGFAKAVLRRARRQFPNQPDDIAPAKSARKVAAVPVTRTQIPRTRSPSLPEAAAPGARLPCPADVARTSIPSKWPAGWDLPGLAAASTPCQVGIARGSRTGPSTSPPSSPPPWACPIPTSRLSRSVASSRAPMRPAPSWPPPAEPSRAPGTGCCTSRRCLTAAGTISASAARFLPPDHRANCARSTTHLPSTSRSGASHTHPPASSQSWWAARTARTELRPCSTSCSRGAKGPPRPSTRPSTEQSSSDSASRSACVGAPAPPSPSPFGLPGVRPPPPVPHPQLANLLGPVLREARAPATAPLLSRHRSRRAQQHNRSWGRCPHPKAPLALQRGAAPTDALPGADTGDAHAAPLCPPCPRPAPVETTTPASGLGASPLAGAPLPRAAVPVASAPCQMPGPSWAMPTPSGTSRQLPTAQRAHQRKLVGRDRPSGRVVACHRQSYSLRQSRHASEHSRLHLCRLYAHPPHLELVVGAARKEQLPVFSPLAQVAGPEPARTVRAHHEARGVRGRQLVLAKVAGRHDVARDPNLAGGADCLRKSPSRSLGAVCAAVRSASLALRPSRKLVAPILRLSQPNESAANRRAEGQDCRDQPGLGPSEPIPSPAAPGRSALLQLAGTRRHVTSAATSVHPYRLSTAAWGNSEAARKARARDRGSPETERTRSAGRVGDVPGAAAHAGLAQPAAPAPNSTAGQGVPPAHPRLPPASTPHTRAAPPSPSGVA
eukprot:scaffold4985_cov116-Isochrysis_galbana.AAC.5